MNLIYPYDLLEFEMFEFDKNYSENDARNLILPGKKRKGKFAQCMSDIFFKNSYTLRLFPEIKQQKPGIDLYAYIATI